MTFEDRMIVRRNLARQFRRYGVASFNYLEADRRDAAAMLADTRAAQLHKLSPAERVYLARFFSGDAA